MCSYTIFSKGIKKIPFLQCYLDGHADKAVLGWGRKENTRKAREYADKKQLPFIALEDGFLRSVNLGVLGAQAVSLVTDTSGIYYDSTNPSELEELIVQSAEQGGQWQDQAQEAMRFIAENALSKYNHAPSQSLPELPSGILKRVLVVDQTRGDVSVLLGGGELHFASMLDAALAENPTAQIIVKTHPDVLSGKKKGYLTDIPALHDPRVLLWAQDCSPVHLLKQVDEVYVYTSQMGFEALMVGKPVQCFGLPWYAGWGVTTDRHPEKDRLLTRRTPNKELWQLFAAAYLQYARYIHPDFGRRGDIFDVMPWLVRNRDAAQQLAGTVYCVGMSFWKRATVKPFLTTHNTQLRFVASLNKLKRMSLAPDAKILIWGSREVVAAQQLAQDKGVPLWRMEDGFVRSVGLGSDLFRPLSLVVDTSGMYYDPHSGSDLEQMLLGGTWDQAQLAQAETYRTDFVTKGISKYNLGGASLSVPVSGKTIILVPGQVEDDASVQYGSPVVQTNTDLIKTVRAHYPDAYILYKPHPDVVAGNRKGRVAAAVLDRYVDQVVAEANIVECIQVADQVHTMTSLTGFEALMHGKEVHCYGGPFYAGWGLTVDHYALPHRHRTLTLSELIYTTIFQYPRYIMPPGVGVPGFAAPESVLEWLAQQQVSQPKQAALSGWYARKKRKAMALWQLFRY